MTTSFSGTRCPPGCRLQRSHFLKRSISFHALNLTWLNAFTTVYYDFMMDWGGRLNRGVPGRSGRKCSSSIFSLKNFEGIVLFFKIGFEPFIRGG
jgi:hypothetical protein